MATISADGNSDAMNWHGGRGNIDARGTFGGGTLTMQRSHDGGTTWVAINTDVTFTAAGTKNFEVPPCLLRVNLAGATGADIEYHINPILRR